MNVINPFVGAIAMTPAAQKQQSADKAAQVRRTQELKRNVAAAMNRAQPDQFEHVVESAEELTPSREHRDEDPRKKKRDTPPTPDGDEQSPADTPEPPRLDLTA